MGITWVQETARNRYYEQGSDGSEVIRYCCHKCGKDFESYREREIHIFDEHPIYRPILSVFNKEIRKDKVDINKEINIEDVEFYNVNFLKIDNVKYDKDFKRSLIRALNGGGFFKFIEYGNDDLKYKVRFSICIPDSQEMGDINRSFINIFCNEKLNMKSIVKFKGEVEEFITSKKYSEGLIRYVLGLITKDGLLDGKEFIDFANEFNQAADHLKVFDTELSATIRAVINFNRNDFEVIGYCGLPDLDNAVQFFKGHTFKLSSKNGNEFPVDFATEFILTRLLSNFENYTFEELDEERQKISSLYLSPQDTRKIEYILWRKCIISNHKEEEVYLKKLRYDNAFSEQLNHYIDNKMG